MRLTRIVAGWFLIAVLLAACALPGLGIPLVSSPEYRVIVHPDGGVFVGDQVSFEVLAPSSGQSAGREVQVSFDGRTIGSAGFQPFGFSERSEAALWWVWNTRDLKPGAYKLTFTVLPSNVHWEETIDLRPSSQVPAPEADAHWASTTTTCCTIYYITGTDAARDISTLSNIADEQSAAVAGQFHTQLKDKITLVFMSRVIGNGGFTLNAVYVSYLDQNYIDNDMNIILHHEFVHVVDGQMGGTFLPPIFEEGLAVYLTGGHFKPEPIAPRAAALLDLGWYIPLEQLANNFYNQQHEIGYLEAAGLVKYLVDTYGWDQFNRFYRSIPDPRSGNIAEAIGTSLQSSLEISFSELESGYQQYLRSQTVTAQEKEDLQVTVDFFNTMRRYQQAFDPSAYFLTAWLPDGGVMRQKGIVADLVRHPQGIANRYLEGQLIQARTDFFGEDYGGAQRSLKWINVVLDVIVH